MTNKPTDIQKDLEDFIQKYYKCCCNAEEIKEFILENKIALLNILKGDNK